MRVVGLSQPHPAAGIGRDDAGRGAAGRDGVIAVKRQVSYQWRVRETVAA
jgi:hypothetical protein